MVEETLIQEKKYNEAELVLAKVIKSDDKNVAAIWYSGNWKLLQRTRQTSHQ